MELQEVIDYARDQYKTDLEKQIAEKLVRLGAENVKYVREGKYSFNHGVNVGQCKALSWVLEQLKAQNERKSCTTDE
jgi:DNA-binding SARP family transcriptional activator